MAPADVEARYAEPSNRGVLISRGVVDGQHRGLTLRVVVGFGECGRACELRLMNDQIIRR